MSPNLSSGFLFVDKESGWTSSDTVTWIKNKLGFKPIGHTGTLDKFATGLLILPFGACTSFSSWFLGLDKVYEARIHFGRKTDSGDPDGEILQETKDEDTLHFLKQNQKAIEQEIFSWTELTEQIPPLVSALKWKGKRYADHYRSGMEVPTRPRPIKIHSVQILSQSARCLDIKIHVSSGTYIRKLALDLSLALAFPAHLSALRRTAIGSWNVELAKPRTELEKGTGYSWREILPMKEFSLSIDEAEKVACGATISRIAVQDPEGQLLVSPGGELLAWALPGSGTQAYRYGKVFSQAL